MLFRFVYRTADIPALSGSLDSAEYISAVRYTNVNGIVAQTLNIFLSKTQFEKKFLGPPDRLTDRQTDRQIDRQTDRNIDRQTDRPTDRQKTDRKSTDRPTDRLHSAKLICMVE